MTKGRKISLFQIVRNSLRILCLVISFHWLIFTNYANCINYRESIGEENDKQADKNIKKHDEKTKKYNKNKEQTIEDIEEDILKQIEEKSGKKSLPRRWKNEELPQLKQLDKEIKELTKKNNDLSEEEKKELDSKRKKYEENLEKAKEKTIENIQLQLKENKLNATDLNDERDWKESLAKDPSRFFFVSPLDKTAKLMGLRNSPDSGWLIVGEIIFKLVAIKLLFYLVSFWETSVVHEGMAKMQNPYLSVEEKEKIQEEISPLFKYMIFNGLMTLLFTVLPFVHPFFIDRTSAWYCKPAEWYYWVLPSFLASLLSIISNEFIRQGRMLSKQEIKDYLIKSWVMIIIFNLIFLVLIPYFLGRNQGIYWFCFCNGAVDFSVNLFTVWIFGLKNKTKKYH